MIRAEDLNVTCAPDVLDFLSTSGCTPPFRGGWIHGGANNRVQLVRQSDGSSAVLKTYFTRASDPRDRFAAEFAFYEHAGATASSWIARTLGWSRKARAALFEFVDGSPVGQVGAAEVADAAEFCRALQQARGNANLPLASEAAFDGSAHAGIVDARLARLSAISGDDEPLRQVRRFVVEELQPRWEAERGQVARVPPLQASGRCVSPSDFGFHNALRRTDGRLCFVDFEYAGMDDPAKLICDFFWQPAVPVPWELLTTFLGVAGDALGASGVLAQRCRVLFPMFGLKWCCILLNEFLIEGAERRDFSSGEGASSARREAQLQKARRVLARVDQAREHSPVP